MQNPATDSGDHDRTPLKPNYYDVWFRMSVADSGHHDRTPLKPVKKSVMSFKMDATDSGHHDRTPLKRCILGESFVCSPADSGHHDRTPLKHELRANPAQRIRLIPVTTTGPH